MPHPIFTYLKPVSDNIEAATVIGGALAMVFRTTRRFVLGAPAAIWKFFRSPFIILEKVERIEDRQIEIASRLERVEKENQFNGGSSNKDMLTKQEAYRRHDFWTSGRPQMEMDGDAQVSLTSEALCRLFGVSTPDDVMRRSWLRFVDAAEVGDLLKVFKGAVETDSMFRYAANIYNSSGDCQGFWEIQAQQIMPSVHGKKLYYGTMAPLDAKAKEMAGRSKFTSCGKCPLK